MHDEDRLSPQKSLKAGFKAVSPLILGVIPFGLIAGIVAIESGLSVLEAMGVSAIIFAGAAQLASLQLYQDGAPLLVILLTITMINLRFMMYSASLGIYFRHLSLGWKALIGYTLTDQAYAVPIARFEQNDNVHKRWFYLGVSLTMWTIWQISTFIGAVVGAGIPSEWQLDFAMPLTFLALLLPVMRNHKHVLAALSSGIVAVAGQGLPYNLGLILATITGIAVGVFAESRQK